MVSVPDDLSASVCFDEAHYFHIKNVQSCHRTVTELSPRQLES